MMEFLAANFNLPTIIVSIFVFGGTGWLLYHEHKTGGLGCCDAGLGHAHGLRQCQRRDLGALLRQMVPATVSKA